MSQQAPSSPSSAGKLPRSVVESPNTLPSLAHPPHYSLCASKSSQVGISGSRLELQVVGQSVFVVDVVRIDGTDAGLPLDLARRCAHIVDLLKLR
eukprot:3299448-Pleurochrysis_carterae.AAC.1